MTQETLQQAIALARSGQKQQARELLQQVLSANPANETAWLWLADAMSTGAERIQVLETCLRFVPDSRAAQAGLTALRRQAAQEQPPEPGVSPEEAETEPQPPVDQAQPAAVEPPGAGASLEPAPETGAEDEGDNEWPDLRDQIELEPWMEDMASDAGPALGSLLGSPTESEGPPARARAYDNLPTLPTRHTETPPAFTVPPDEVTDEEFSQVESRTEAELRSKPEIWPVEAEDEAEEEEELDSLEDLFDPITSDEADDERDLSPYISAQREPEQAEDLLAGWSEPDLQPEAELPPDAPEQDARLTADVTGNTQPVRRSRRSDEQKQPRGSRTLLFILLIIIGLVGIAAVLFGLLNGL